MSVAAQSANDPASAATVALQRSRGTRAQSAGTYPYDADDLTTGWHQHDMHQLEYAFHGVVEVQTSSARYLLPPQQAVWIPAGLTHNTTLRRVRTVSVFFDPAVVGAQEPRARVFLVQPVLREMIVYASRWPVGREDSDPVADTFFTALGALVADGLRGEKPFHLPTALGPDTAAAIRYTDEHLQSVTLAQASRAAAVSERTLRRRFAAETGLTWRQYLNRSRLLRAMTLLSEPGVSVLRAATDSGFDSASAFARSFAAYTGVTPSAYRQLAAPSTDPAAADTTGPP